MTSHVAPIITEKKQGREVELALKREEAKLKEGGGKHKADKTDTTDKIEKKDKEH